MTTPRSILALSTTGGVGVFLLLLTVLLLAAPAPAAPKITWSPRSLSLSVLPGTTTTVSLSVISNADLQNPGIVVVPELRSLISVEPSSMQSVRTGSPINLTLTVTTSHSLANRVLDGTIHLTAERSPKTLSKPLPVRLEIGDNVRLEAFGEAVIFALPPSYIVNRPTPEQLLFSVDEPIGDSDTPGVIEASILPIDLNETAQLLRDSFATDLIEENILIGTATARKLSGRLRDHVLGWGGYHHSFLLLPLANRTLQLEYDSESTTTTQNFEVLLSTLQIL